MFTLSATILTLAQVTCNVRSHSYNLSGVSRGGSGAGSLGGAQQLTEGGGVVAKNFRDLQKPSRFSGGGGSSRNFP